VVIIARSGSSVQPGEGNGPRESPNHGRDGSAPTGRASKHPSARVLYIVCMGGTAGWMQRRLQKGLEWCYHDVNGYRRPLADLLELSPHLPVLEIALLVAYIAEPLSVSDKKAQYPHLFTLKSWLAFRLLTLTTPNTIVFAKDKSTRWGSQSRYCKRSSGTMPWQRIRSRSTAGVYTCSPAR